MCTDFSDVSERAFPFAAALGKLLGCPIRLIHVSDIDVFHGGVSGEGRRPWEDDLLRYIEERLATSAARLAALGVSVETRVKTGIAAHVLIEEAKDDVRMAVIATRGHGGILRALLGSVAMKFVQESPVPVLVVPHDAELRPYDKVLLPVDLSELTTGVLADALELLRALGASAEFFHAHVPVNSGTAGLLPVPTESLELDGQVEERVKEFAAHATLAGVTSTWAIAHGHSASRAIVERAAQIDAGLIMMPGHGRRGLERLILGSVAEKVVKKSDRPVLVLKAN
jgi:nucleotide-binding universal stress UspA family protein